MTKGSGMIEPLMATMLGFLTCDAQVEPAMLRKALAAVTRDTFNAITVDGECSTNDTVFAMASGASGVVIDESLYPALEAGLRAVSKELAIGIVRGGEGATKLVTIRVIGANGMGARRAGGAHDCQLPAREDRRCTAAIPTGAGSSRPRAARGCRSSSRARPSASAASCCSMKGSPTTRMPKRPRRTSRARRSTSRSTSGTGGSEQATIWTCDLSAEYVRINADYRT